MISASKTTFSLNNLMILRPKVTKNRTNFRKKFFESPPRSVVIDKENEDPISWISRAMFSISCPWCNLKISSLNWGCKHLYARGHYVRAQKMMQSSLLFAFLNIKLGDSKLLSHLYVCDFAVSVLKYSKNDKLPM